MSFATMAILHLQYSTQWDSLAHIGQMFDADGDGIPEPVSTTATCLCRRLCAQGRVGCRPRRRALRIRPRPRMGWASNMAERCGQGRAVMMPCTITSATPDMVVYDP